jgi:hypothetical protein
MTKLYPVNPETNLSGFLKARVIGDYNQLYGMCVKLKQNMDKLNVIRNENKQLGQR